MGKLKWVLVFCICICGFVTFGQNHLVTKLDDKKSENLASLAKVWGFLKYYHPNVAKGNFNWDEQLIQMIPKVEQAQNKDDLSRIYLEWIAAVGVVKECNPVKKLQKRNLSIKTLISPGRKTQLFLQMNFLKN